MELQDKPLDPAESLQLIHQFISDARYNAHKSAFTFIFWGILISITAFGHYFLIRFTRFSNPWLLWPVLMGGGFLFSIIYHAVKYNGSGLTSTYGRFFRWLFISGGVTYFLLAFLCVSQQVSPLPFMLALTSLLVFVAGMILRFSPLILGGVLFFLTSIVSVFMSPLNQLLLMATSVLLGYLLPGIFLMREKKEQC